MCFLCGLVELWKGQANLQALTITKPSFSMACFQCQVLHFASALGMFHGPVIAATGRKMRVYGFSSCIIR